MSNFQDFFLLNYLINVVPNHQFGKNINLRGPQEYDKSYLPFNSTINFREYLFIIEVTTAN